MLKLVWDAKRSEGLLEYAAYKCEPPSACRSGAVASGSLVTKPAAALCASAPPGQPPVPKAELKATVQFRSVIDALDNRTMPPPSWLAAAAELPEMVLLRMVPENPPPNA